MSKSGKTTDLTQGNILRKILVVAVPIMGSQFLQMAYNLTDMFWLGRHGSDAVAASGAAGMFMWMAQAFLLIGRMGAEIGVSNAIGKADKTGAEGFARSAIQIAAVLGVLFTVIVAVFKSSLIGIFGFQETNVVSLAENYLLIVCISMPLTYISSAIVGVFNASGNSRTPFFINMAGVGINVVLDPLLIFKLNMGVAGAAIATVAAQTLVFFITWLLFVRGKNRPFAKLKILLKPDAAKVRQLFKWTIPVSLESLLFTVLALFTSRMEAGFGAYAMAVSRVGSQIESLSWLIGGGFGSALTTFVGQNHGAGRQKRISAGFKISACLMAVWGFCVMLVLLLLGGRLFLLFLPQAELLPLAVQYLGIIALCQIPSNLEGVSSGAFRGMGRTVPPSFVSICSNILRVILAFVLSATPLGLTGVWWGISISTAIRGLWSFIWYVVYDRRRRIMLAGADEAS